MKSKKILTLIFTVLLVFSLFGCGKKEPVADVEPQDTVEQEELTPVVTEEEEKQEPVELTQEELHALFKKEYEFFKWAKANLYDNQYQEYYLKLPARKIGTQTDANVYADIEAEVAKPEYEGKILPDDGFEQYVAWREALESGSSGNNQSGNTSGNTGNTGNTGGQTQQKPSGGNGSSVNNGGSSGGINGGTSQNVDDTAHIRDGSGATKPEGARSDDEVYDKPSYEIVG